MKQVSEVPDELVDKALQAEHEQHPDEELLDEFEKWTDYITDEEERHILRSGMRAALVAVWENIYAYGYTDGFSDKVELEGDVSVYEVVDRYTRLRLVSAVYLTEHEAFQVIEKNGMGDVAMVQGVPVTPKEES